MRPASWRNDQRVQQRRRRHAAATGSAVDRRLARWPTVEDAGVGKEVTLRVVRGDAERGVKVRVVDLGA